MGYAPDLDEPVASFSFASPADSDACFLALRAVIETRLSVVHFELVLMTDRGPRAALLTATRQSQGVVAIGSPIDPSLLSLRHPHEGASGSDLPPYGETSSNSAGDDAVHAHDARRARAEEEEEYLSLADFARRGPQARDIENRAMRRGYHIPASVSSSNATEKENRLGGPCVYVRRTSATRARRASMAHWQMAVLTLQHAWKAHRFRRALKQRIIRGARRTAMLTLGARLARYHIGWRITGIVASYAVGPATRA